MACVADKKVFSKIDHPPSANILHIISPNEVFLKNHATFYMKRNWIIC